MLVVMMVHAAALLGQSASSRDSHSNAAHIVHSDPLNRDALVRAAYDRFYILDYPGALERFEKIAAAHPGNALATDYVLDTTLFAELYRLDLLDTTLYAHDGFLSNHHPVEEDKQVTAQIFNLADKAIGEAEDELKKDPKDVNALYARGWAKSMKATYIGLVQHRFVPALRIALQSRSDDEKVLSLDPDYVDAKLVVGIHQYVAGCLPLAFKLMAGLMGAGGSKEKGLSMLREAGQYGVITSVEARTALMLFLRREAKYGEAAQVAKGLKDEYPHDFLFWLEEANLMKDAGNASQAITRYRATLEQAKKAGFFPNAHLELAWYGLGDTLRGQHQAADSAAAFSQAALQPEVNIDLKRRAELAAGQQYDILNQRDRATAAYQAVLRDGADSPEAPEAKKYLRTPFRN